MAVKGYFYNSVKRDRLYNGQDMNEDKAPFYKEGVVYGHLVVTAGEGMTVKVDGGTRTGYAYINLHTIHNTTVLELQVSQASGTLPRIDRVVLRNNETERKPDIFILEGAYSSNPQPPELTNTDVIQEKCLAEIYVAAGAVEITQADITDTRADPTLCGFVASQFIDFDFSQLTLQFNSWVTQKKASMEKDHADFIEEYANYTKDFIENQEADWNEWFNFIKEQLTTDAAGKLLNNIQRVESRLSDYLPLMGGTMTGPITTTSHIYGIDATTGECTKDIDLDGDNISFGKRVSEANDAAWKTKIGIGDNTVSIESDILKFNGNGTSAIITENRANFSFAKGKFTEIISSSGKVDLNTKDSFIMDIMGELTIGISEELNLVTGHKANIASATEIRLVPGAADADSPPAADKYVKTGNIKGIKDANGNKPSISNFGDIRSETYNGNKILGTNGGIMDDGAEICFTKAEGSDSYSSNISAGQCVFAHVTPSQYTSDCHVEICADYIKVASAKFRNQSTHIRSYGIVSSGNLNNDYIIKMNDVGIRIFDGSVTPIYSSSPSTDLGGSNDSYKWRNIYAINGTIQTSDRTKKNNITKLPGDLVKDFIMGLQPSTYRMTDGTSGRTHWGLIAQDIEELMEHLGIDSKDFAGFIKSPKIIIQNTDENGNALEEPVKEVVGGEYDYSLRYDEFIAPIIKVTQMQQVEIESLKADKAQLEERIARLEEKIGILQKS